MRRVAAVVFALAAAAAGFYFYGVFRTMAETFGFSATATASSVLFAAFFTSPAFLAVLLAGWITRKFDPGIPIAVLGAGLLAGCVTSETWLLVDEARFSAEVARLDPGQSHDRGRAWPFLNAGLVFVPGRGIHATD